VGKEERQGEPFPQADWVVDPRHVCPATENTQGLIFEDQNWAKESVSPENRFAFTKKIRNAVEQKLFFLFF
jgi:hypothetical protein